MRRWAGLEPKVGDRVELRVVDASLARGLFAGLPASRLLARARLALDVDARGVSWDERMAALLGAGSPELERVTRGVARQARAAANEGGLPADDTTLAVLALAVASETEEPGTDASLAEIAPLLDARAAWLRPATLTACAAHDERLARPGADKRAIAYEVCLRLATRARLGPTPWERMRAIAAQLERAEIGVTLLAGSHDSVFPVSIDESIAAHERRATAVERESLDRLVAMDPRQLGAAIWRAEQASGGAAPMLASFLADLGRLLAHEGKLVVLVSPPDPIEIVPEALRTSSGGSWLPAEWSQTTACALAESLERGATTFASVRAAAMRGGEPALDAMGAEMLRAGGHAFASAAFAEILARSGRPRDVLRLVTYFAIAPDPGVAARALGACDAVELPRVLRAWLEAMLPPDDDAPDDANAARVSACIASLRPYPNLYRAVERLLPRIPVAS